MSATRRRQRTAPPRHGRGPPPRSRPARGAGGASAKLRAFEACWRSGAPLLGEPRARGWAAWHARRQAGLPAEEPEDAAPAAEPPPPLPLEPGARARRAPRCANITGRVGGGGGGRVRRRRCAGARAGRGGGGRARPPVLRCVWCERARLKSARRVPLLTRRCAGERAARLRAPAGRHAAASARACSALVHHVAARGRPRAEPEEEGGCWSGWVPLAPAAAAAAAAADADAAAEAAGSGGEPTAGGGGGADGALAGEPAADADADAEAEPPPEAGDCQPRPDSPDSLVFAGRRPLWCNHAAPADAAHPPDE